MSSFGSKIKVNIFGESHGPAVGVVIEGLEAGFPINMESVREMMDRRRPGTGRQVTARNEADVPEILSGVYEGKTTGMPLCAIIRNKDTRSKDYKKLQSVPRPGHSDFTARLKFDGFNDIRGGGAFSGRLTAPLVFAGALAKDLLLQKGVTIVSHLLSLGGVKDEPLNNMEKDDKQGDSILKNIIPMIDGSSAKLAYDVVNKARSDGDSVGSVIETVIYGVPAGTGGVLYDSFESRLSKVCFGVPGVKGIEFGLGFEMADMRGSGTNDAFHMDNGKVRTVTNNMGGILGGIANGMPVVFKTVMKPTASIAKKQKSVDLDTKTETELEIGGRHDPCIGIRAVPVMEACAALVTLDYIMEA